MTPEDLADLHAVCFPDAPWTAASFADVLKQPTTHLITEHSGFVLARVIAPEAEILTLCTHPRARRHGIATRLVHAVCAQSPTVFLEVAADNMPAQSLYRACGFAETGRRHAYYARGQGPRIDAVLMTWTNPA